MIWRIQGYVKDNHIKAIIKYKWFDDIIPLCTTGLMNLEQSNVLYDFCKNKTSIDKEIKDALNDYIYKCKVRKLMIKQYSGMNVFLSRKIVDCNFGDLDIALMNAQAYYMDYISRDTDFAILGINDQENEKLCKELGINYCYSSDFAIKNIKI